MRIPEPVKGLFGLGAVLVVASAIGAVVGVGPLSGMMPADQVRDPNEMVARSLSAVMDTSAVHLDITLEGTVPGEVLGWPEDAVDLSGTTASVDLRPRDVRSRIHLESPGSDVYVDAVTEWDTAWYRTAAGESWTKGSIGVLASGTNLDLNPLFLADKVREYLAASAGATSVEDVPCASASGTCHEVVLQAGPGPGRLIAALLPAASRGAFPVTASMLTLDTDAKTLRPARVELDVMSEDGAVDLVLTVDVRRWDDGSIVIGDPTGSG